MDSTSPVRDRLATDCSFLSLGLHSMPKSPLSHENQKILDIRELKTGQQCTHI